MSTTVVSVRDRSTKLLDAKKQQDEIVTPEDATDGVKLGRLLTRMLAELAALRRRFAPKRTTFRDIVSTGAELDPQRFTLIHKFGGVVEWWVVGVNSLGLVELPLVAEVVDESDDSSLVLDVYFEGTIAVRVEEAG